MRSTLSSCTGKGSPSPHDGCSKCGGAHFQRDSMHAKAQASNRLAKANRASHAPRVSPHSQAKAREKKTRENPKENLKEPKVRAKGVHKGKASKAGPSGLENSKSETSSDIQESAQTCFMMDGVLTNGMRTRMRDIHVGERGSEGAGEGQPEKLRKTVRFEQDAPNASASSDPTVALKYPASGETQDRPGPYSCRSRAMLMTTYQFLRWMHSMRWMDEKALHRRSVGMVSRRRCRRSQEK